MFDIIAVPVDGSDYGYQAADVAIEIAQKFNSKIAAVNLEAYAILGDVDWDGDIDIFDASAVIDMIYGRTELDKKHADVNRDGVVDVFDASTVVDMIYGRI